MSGSGCGVFILGPTIVYLVDFYGWRGAMLICSGLSVNFCVFGASVYSQKKTKKKFSIYNDDKLLNHFDKQKLDSLHINNKYKNNFIEYKCADENSHFLNENDAENSKKLLELGLLKSNLFEKDKNCFSKIKKYIQCKFIKNQSSVCKEDKILQEKELMKVKKSVVFNLLRISCFLCVLTTTTLFAILQDWVEWMNFGEYFAYSLSSLGLGDLIGRLFAGIIPKTISPIIVFIWIQIFLGITIGLSSVSINHYMLVVSLGFVGISFGVYSVIFALIPSKITTGRALNWVLGQLLLASGFGALLGPPLAGAIVDSTKSYTHVLIMCSAAPCICALLNFIVYLTIISKNQVQEGEKV